MPFVRVSFVATILLVILLIPAQIGAEEGSRALNVQCSRPSPVVVVDHAEASWICIVSSTLESGLSLEYHCTMGEDPFDCSGPSQVVGDVYAEFVVNIASTMDAWPGSTSTGALVVSGVDILRTEYEDSTTLELSFLSTGVPQSNLSSVTYYVGDETGLRPNEESYRLSSEPPVELTETDWLPCNGAQTPLAWFDTSESDSTWYVNLSGIFKLVVETDGPPSVDSTINLGIIMGKSAAATGAFTRVDPANGFQTTVPGRSRSTIDVELGHVLQEIPAGYVATIRVYSSCTGPGIYRMLWGGAAQLGDITMGVERTTEEIGATDGSMDIRLSGLPDDDELIVEAVYVQTSGPTGPLYEPVEFTLQDSVLALERGITSSEAVIIICADGSVLHYHASQNASPTSASTGFTWIAGVLIAMIALTGLVVAAVTVWGRHRSKCRLDVFESGDEL